MKAAQQHSKNLLFWLLLREAKTRYASRLPSRHDGSILSESCFCFVFCFLGFFWFYFQTNSDGTRNVSSFAPSFSSLFLALFISKPLRRSVSLPVFIESRFILMKFEEPVCVCSRGMTPSYHRQGRPSVLTTRSHLSNFCTSAFFAWIEPQWNRYGITQLPKEKEKKQQQQQKK